MENAKNATVRSQFREVMLICVLKIAAGLNAKPA